VAKKRIQKKGFFSHDEIGRKLSPENRSSSCGVCGLYKAARTPKMELTGEGKKKILFVAEAPGADEDRKGVQLIGECGQLLRRFLGGLNFDLDEDAWKTNAVICRPPHNETPNDEKIDCCRPNLFQTIRKLDPNAIVILGATPLKSIIGHVWKENPGSISQWAGNVIPCQNPNAWIIPTYHPSYILRMRKFPDKPGNRPLEYWFRQHLKAAIEIAKTGKPWETIIPYEKEVEVITGDKEAAEIIDGLTESGRYAAFDYETNCLKPELPKAKIVSCSICFDGKKTIAYPWYGKAVEATKRFLNSPIRKIAANLKFEDRWSRKIAGTEVMNWWWDTMINSHIINNKEGTTGLKFQAFAFLGCPPYADHIKPYLEPPKGTPYNRIDELDIYELLKYNGLDSLHEYRLAFIQKEKISNMKVGS
jgi:DNA polymerase